MNYFSGSLFKFFQFLYSDINSYFNAIDILILTVKKFPTTKISYLNNLILKSNLQLSLLNENEFLENSN